VNAQNNRDSWDEFVRLSATAPELRSGQVGLVPGAAVPILSLDLPRGLQGQAREQVALRQLRDRAGLTADQIELRPFASGARQEEWHRVLVADPDHLAAWRQQAGAACRAVLPDYLALPTSNDVWTVTHSAGQVRARLGPDDGFTAPAEMALAIFERQLRDEASKPQAIYMLNGSLPALQALADTHEIPVVTESKALETLGLQIPRVLAHGELAYDLRRDPQLARSRLQATLAAWRWPLLVGLIAAGIWITAAQIEIARREAQIAALSAQTEAMVREYFIPDAPLLDLRAQVAQALAQRSATQGERSGSAATALDHFAQASEVIAEDDVQLISAAAPTADDLVLVVELANFADADGLFEKLRRAGLKVDVVETRVTNNTARVRSELRISEAMAENTGEP